MKQPFTLRQLLKCLLLRNLAYLRSLPRQVREARRSPFYRHALDTWRRPRQAASAVTVIAVVLWTATLTPVYILSETALPRGSDGNAAFLWVVIGARLAIALAMVATAAFCGAQAFGPERSGGCMEQLVLLPVNRRRLLLARTLPTLEPLLAGGLALLVLDLAGLAAAALLHGRASAAMHLAVPALAIAGVIYAGTVCAIPLTAMRSLLACGIALYVNLQGAKVIAMCFFALSLEQSALGAGESVACVPEIAFGALLLPAFLAGIAILANRAAPRFFEANALNYPLAERERMSVERHGRGPTSRYLRQFRWWAFLSDDLIPAIRRCLTGARKFPRLPEAAAQAGPGALRQRAAK